jgi:AcrR family transcriptional regulator
MGTHTKREEQRERILEAAYELVAEVGISGLRTREIACRANVNVAMLHYCFENKDGLLKALYKYIVSKAHSELENNNINLSSARENIRALMILKLHYLMDRPVTSRAWRAFCGGVWTHKAIQEVMGEHIEEVRGKCAEAVLRARKSGDLTMGQEYSDDFLASLLIAVLDGFVFQWTASGETFPLVEYFGKFLDILGLADINGGSDGDG